ncbi:MAG: hypothetical protein AAFR70_12020, partial [Pseudomonadota bacterium]
IFRPRSSGDGKRSWRNRWNATDRRVLRAPFGRPSSVVGAYEADPTCQNDRPKQQFASPKHTRAAVFGMLNTQLSHAVSIQP